MKRMVEVAETTHRPWVLSENDDNTKYCLDNIYIIHIEILLSTLYPTSNISITQLVHLSSGPCGGPGPGLHLDTTEPVSTSCKPANE